MFFFFAAELIENFGAKIKEAIISTVSSKLNSLKFLIAIEK